MSSRQQPPIASPAAEHGFTMIVAMLVMFITSLLLVAAFTAANGDIHNSHTDLTQKQAYYAALAGVQEYENTLQANPNYWQTCPSPKGELSGEKAETYEVTTLAASTDPEKGSEAEEKPCNAASPFSSIIQSKGKLSNTFRIKSVGKAGKSSRAVIATFQVSGFLNYIYFTQYEVADPESYSGGNPECANYYARRQTLKLNCVEITFGPEDSVFGPLHTDDAAHVCEGVEFGRPGHEDAVEINGGVIVNTQCGSGGITYNSPTKGPVVGPEIEAPQSDTSMRAYVEHSPQQNEFNGRTTIVLEGEQFKVTYFKNGTSSPAVTETLPWPKNGLIFVSGASTGCGYTNFEQENTDTTTTYEQEKGCGSVYVSGNYKKSLTIAAEQDVIVNGSITPTGVTPSAKNAPPGTSAMGLIATRFVRVYHPCSNGNNSTSGPAGGFLENPWIYSAILSTSHSFLVDNYTCGSQMGNLNVYGAIAQKFRGIVGLVGQSGYNKEYIYDERLATDEPPYYLSPLKSGWRIERETNA